MRLITASRLRRVGAFSAFCSLAFANLHPWWQHWFFWSLVMLGVGVGLWDSD